MFHLNRIQIRIVASNFPIYLTPSWIQEYDYKGPNTAEDAK